MASIYIHIPYCKQKCIYCNFHFRISQNNKNELLQSINKELEIRQCYLDKKVVQSIYFGGGTPSILKKEEIQNIINTIYHIFNVDKNAEVTLECNPDDLDKEFLAELKKIGINRLSIGVQSFNDSQLKLMNRSHNAKQARECVELARKIGFRNITIDLIYGLPNQNNKDWKKDLTTMFKLGVQHFSAYTLTIEPKTALKKFIEKKIIPQPEDKAIIEQFNTVIELAYKNNFVHYEISSFGKKGFFSKHNSAYWENKHYLGIGPSAHSFNGATRQANVSSNKQYIENIKTVKPYFTIEKLSNNQLYNEYLLTRLRTIWGVNLTYITTHFGENTKNYFEIKIKKWIETKKVMRTNNIFTLTKKGKLYADGIAADLFMI